MYYFQIVILPVILLFCASQCNLWLEDDQTRHLDICLIPREIQFLEIGLGCDKREMQFVVSQLKASAPLSRIITMSVCLRLILAPWAHWPDLVFIELQGTRWNIILPDT